jgi:hypothetical protein
MTNGKSHGQPFMAEISQTHPKRQSYTISTILRLQIICH